MISPTDFVLLMLRVGCGVGVIILTVLGIVFCCMKSAEGGRFPWFGTCVGFVGVAVYALLAIITEP